VDAAGTAVIDLIMIIVMAAMAAALASVFVWIVVKVGLAVLREFDIRPVRRPRRHAR
jgi:hypothetical protein